MGTGNQIPLCKPKIETILHFINDKISCPIQNFYRHVILYSTLFDYVLFDNKEIISSSQPASPTGSF